MKGNHFATSVIVQNKNFQTPNEDFVQAKINL